MQPKFTQQKLSYFCAKLVTMVLFLATFSQLTFAQNLPGAVKKPTPKLLMQKKAGLDNNKGTPANSVGLAPVQAGANKKKIEPQNPTAGNPASRAFCYQTVSNPPLVVRLNAQSLLNTTLTPRGPAVSVVFPGAATFNTTNGVLYSNDQASPFGLYTVDTLTGIRTFVVNCSGVPQANFTGMTWDATTNTMYGASTSLSASQIFTINLTTGVCTPIGAPTAVAPGVIMLNAAPGGSLFAVDIVNDRLYRFNKTTGVPTSIGTLGGLDANFGQDGHFDPSDGQYFWAGVGNNFGPSLRIIDTLTGASTLVGNYVNQVETFSIFSAPTAPCSGTPAPGNTLCSASPAACSGVPFTLSLQNNPYVVLNHQWQSSPTGVAGSYVNIPGSPNSPIFITSQTAATYYRCNVNCPVSGITTASNPVFVADGQGVFNTQPSNATTQCGGSATFSFTATGNALVYGWEYRVTPASPWLTVPNSGLYSGALTNTLTITNPPITMNGYQYRGLISGPCTAVDFTNIVTLSVTPYIVNVNPASASICAGTLQPLTITNTVAGALSATFLPVGFVPIPVPDGNAAPSLTTITVSGIPAGSIITNVRVHLNMLHTYPADMIFNLKGPAAANILSLYKHNTNTDNGASSVPTAGFIDAVCSKLGTIQWKAVPTPFRYGQTLPTGPFAADALNGVTNPGYAIMDPTGWASNVTTFDALMPVSGLGRDPNGVWTLAMADGGFGDIGTLTGWSIDIDYVAPVFAQGVWTSSPAAPNTMWATAAGSGGAPYVAGTPATTIWVNPLVNTNYTVVVNTATPCVSAPTVVPVTVSNPIVGLAVTPATRAVCLGQGTTFTAATTSGGPLTYQWQVSIDGGITYTNITGATSQVLTLTNVVQLMNNNKYRCNVSSGPCGSITTGFGLLTTIQLPVVTIGAPDLALTPGQYTTITATSSPAAASYAWTRNGSSIGGLNTNTRTASVDSIGTYRVTVIDINGCTSNSNNLVIGSEQSDRLWLYPNPTTGAFTVRLFFGDALAENRFVSVYNPLGQVVATKEVVLTNASDPYTKIDFDLSKQAAGTYVVKVAHKHTGKVTSGLIIKQ